MISSNASDGAGAADAVDATSNEAFSQPQVEKENVREAYQSPHQSSDEAERKSPHGVDVPGAQREFAELQRQLTGLSQASRQSQSRRSGRKGAPDVEKAVSPVSSEVADPFDLEDTLRGNKKLEEETGIREKQIGVMWDRLTVRGLGGAKIFVPTFPDAFANFALFPVRRIMAALGVGRKGQEVDILRDFRGVIKPGEMVLVLGKPGSGCTTFLKVIANQRLGYTSIDGDVSYGPFSSGKFEKRYRGEAVYCQENDVHLPTLTVGQTLGFALETKVPGKRPGGISAAEFKEKVVNTLLRMFKIEHTKGTIVGNSFVRGISGGERKRVSIAEMMVTGAAVTSHDNSTRGLDASTAFDYAKSLRIITNIYKTTTFVSLYQASENIYSQFDKVIVIDQGRQVYLGPAAEARAYFEGLGFKQKPRQTTPDYLTGCTDPFEREYQEGRDEGNAPSDPDALVAAFRASKFATQLSDEMDGYRQVLDDEHQIHDNFRTAVQQGKRHAPQHSVYTIPLYLQVWALMKRQFTLKWQDRFSLTVSWLTSIIIAILIGTMWLQSPRNSAGAFTRGGVIFISLLFNSISAFGELGAVMTGRSIVNTHRSYTFYRPSALWIAQIGVDGVFAAAQIMVFSVLVYFMCGLVYDASAFFSFYLTIISTYLAITLLFRTVACTMPDFDSAIKIVATIFTLYILTSGYLIQYPSMPVWLRWFSYVNPLGLGFSSLMISEFRRIDLTCSGASLVPSGPGYGNIDHQVCTLQGSTAGSRIVSGLAYIRAGFAYSLSFQWRNYGILVVLIVVFLVSNAFLGERIRWGAGGKPVTFFVKEDKHRAELNRRLREKKTARKNKEKVQAGVELHIESKAVLTWENICYDVPVPSGQLRLLKNVYGYVRPGELVSICGVSGAGKTTLLDVLAHRKNIGVISGDELIDGRPPGSDFQRGTSYAEQFDVHEGTQTVREALRFSAELRQPFETPLVEKHAYVEEIIALLEMEDIADAVIGSPEAGLVIEQRKRVTIGVELAAKPELLLFLDEPTSGLDSQSAFNIVRFLRKLALAGQAILCTIHQPNASLFENFDRLLLLQKGGETVYFGDIGKDAGVLRSYFHKYGADCPPEANPAEWMLDAIRIGDRDWGDIWSQSSELAETQETILRLKRERMTSVGLHPPTGQKEYATPLWHQIKTVNKRQHLAFWRTPNYGFTRLFNHVIVALLTGLIFLHIDDDRTSLQYRVFVCFQATVLPALILSQVEPKYDLSRLIFYRESASKSYRHFPFALSMVLAEVPYSLLCAVGFFLPIYYIPGFNPSTARASYFFLIVLVTELFAVTLGQTISAWTPSTFIAVLFNPFVIIVFALLCGVTVPKPSIPGFWRAWLYELNPFTRLIGGLVSNELHDLRVTCRDRELNRFSAPPDQTCGAYTAAYFAAGGPGYLVDPGAQDCAYCAYRVGDEFFEPLGIRFAHRWRNFGILSAFIASNLVLLFVGSRYMNFNRR